MEDTVLPNPARGPGEHVRALRGAIVRYQKDEQPVRYDQVRGVESTSASSCLKFFGELGLLEIEKAGTYVPTDAIVNFFSDDESTAASGRAGVRELLNNSFVFDETVFIAEHHEYSLKRLAEELADDIASDEDEDEDIQKAVQRFVEIFIELGFFEIDGQDHVRLNDIAESDGETTAEESENSPADGGSTDRRGSTQLSSRAKNTTNIHPDSVSEPPARTDPEKLYQLCVYMKDAGAVSPQEIEDDDDIELSNDYVRHSLDYAESLGFIQPDSSADEERYELTESGWELGYHTNLEEAMPLFRSALINSDEFCHVIQTLSEDASVQEHGYIGRNTALRIYRARFGLTDVGEDRLKRGVTTLFKTLEAAGYGQYKQGSGSNPTRVELNSIEELVEDFETTEPEGDATEDSPVDVEDGSAEAPQADNSTEGDLDAVSDDDSVQHQPQPEPEIPLESRANGGNRGATAREAVVTIDVNLDLAEIDADDLEQKLEAISRFLDEVDYNT